MSLDSLNAKPLTLVPECLAVKQSSVPSHCPSSSHPFSLTQDKKAISAPSGPGTASTVNNTPGAREIAQQVKALAIKSDDLHLNPSTKTMEGENRLHQVISELHMNTVTHTIYTDRQIKCNRFFKEGYSRIKPLLPAWLQVCLYSCHRNVICFTFIIFYYFYILFIIFLIKWYFLYQVFLFLAINHLPNYDTEIYY